jgi:hypothetical protein
MHEALCRSFGTTLDMVHDEGGPPLTQRTSGLAMHREHENQHAEDDQNPERYGHRDGDAEPPDRVAVMRKWVFRRRRGGSTNLGLGRTSRLIAQQGY